VTRCPAVERLPEVKLGRHSCSRRSLDEKEFAFTGQHVAWAREKELILKLYRNLIVLRLQ
jgi:hypothetical protein